MASVQVIFEVRTECHSIYKMLGSRGFGKETQAQSLVEEHPLEKGVATHSSILAWIFPWTEEANRL